MQDSTSFYVKSNVKNLHKSQPQIKILTAFNVMLKFLAKELAMNNNATQLIELLRSHTGNFGEAISEEQYQKILCNEINSPENTAPINEEAFVQDFVETLNRLDLKALINILPNS